jgi:hypothetical protein
MARRYKDDITYIDDSSIFRGATRGTQNNSGSAGSETVPINISSRSMSPMNP